MTYLQPLFPFLVGLVLALALRVRPDRPRTRRALRIAAAALFLWSWPPVAWLASASLERFYPLRDPDVGGAQAIVVLGGGIRAPTPSAPAWVPGADTSVRARQGAWLAKTAPDLPVVVSGGGDGDGPTVSEGLAVLLEQQGVARERILVEARSRSTWENAARTRDLLAARGIARVAVVTDAHHMLRSERAFRRAGLEVVPCPVAFRSEAPTRALRFVLPAWSAVRENEDALHEWVGLLWYRLRGRA